MNNLYSIATDTIHPIKLKKNGEAGHVACALETASGAVYTGICIVEIVETMKKSL